jgi:prolipoprotein diacylglyceryltransferase
MHWLTGITGAVLACIVMSRVYKVRLGLILDAMAVSLPLPIIFGKALSLAGQYEKGREAVLPWAVRLGSDVLPRHPVQLYEMVVLLCISAVLIRLTAVSEKQKWGYGMVGAWFFMLYALTGFILEFLKDAPVYWGGLTANQWVFLCIFAECTGVLFIRGGGREVLRKFWMRIVRYVQYIKEKTYGFISRRNSKKSPDTSQ